MPQNLTPTASLLVLFSLGVPLAAQACPSWTHPSTANVGTSSLHGMVYDSTRARTVMFGGWAYLFHNQFRNQTWEWDGAAWTQIVTATSPSPRSHCMIAFDAARGRVVLFGGYLAGTTLGDTWEYDGTNWYQLSPAHAPSPRSSAGLAFDAARGVTVLFGGGFGPTGDILNAETWEWNGSDWLQRFPANAPSPRSDPGMCYDPLHQRVFLHRGYISAPLYGARDLWQYDGVDWTLRSQNEGPALGYNGGLVWHPGRQRLIACVHEPSGVETWSWDGTRWHKECSTGTPSGRRVFQMAYHAATDRGVVYGGDVGASGTFSDTFLLDAGNPLQAAVTSFGSGCAGTAGTATLQALNYPMLGTSFVSRLTNVPSGLAIFVIGFSDTLWNAAPLPLPLGPIGLPPACTGYVSADAVVWVPHAGTADYALAIPCNPALQGLMLFVQGAGIDLGLTTPVPLVTSNALRTTLGS